MDNGCVGCKMSMDEINILKAEIKKYVTQAGKDINTIRRLENKFEKLESHIDKLRKIIVDLENGD